MADDPYKTLGVKKDASQEEIQKAYRRRAKKLHPDLNPGDRQAEEQFKEVSAAYDLLSDPEKRKGEPGFGERPPGDAHIEVHVRPHPIFRRDGDDLRIELPLSLRDAVLGGKLRVPTPTGTVTMTIPKWTNSGAKRRLKGKGVLRRDGTRGDEYVTLKIVLPEKPDPELERLIAQWQPRERTTQATEA